MSDIVIDVRTLPHAQRHEQIFASVATLGKDEGVVIISDHDPKPLQYQLKAMYGEKLEWTYLGQGSQEWRVRIGWARP